MEDLKTLHDQALGAAGQARKAVENNAMLLQQKLAERTKLLSQLEQAKMQETVARSLESMSNLAAPGTTPSLDEVRDKIERRYATRWAGPTWPRTRWRAGGSRCRRPPSTWPAPPAGGDPGQHGQRHGPRAGDRSRPRPKPSARPDAAQRGVHARRDATRADAVREAERRLSAEP